MDNRKSLTSFQAKQTEFAEQVKAVNTPLFNALNVELERTESTVFIPHWEVIAASLPGIMKDRSHEGYAETEDLNDVNEAFSRLTDSACFVIADNKGWVYPELMYNSKSEIKQAKERYTQNNLSGSGRLLAKFNYLLQHEL